MSSGSAGAILIQRPRIPRKIATMKKESRRKKPFRRLEEIGEEIRKDRDILVGRGERPGNWPEPGCRLKPHGIKGLVGENSASKSEDKQPRLSVPAQGCHPCNEEKCCPRNAGCDKEPVPLTGIEEKPEQQPGCDVAKDVHLKRTQQWEEHIGSPPVPEGRQKTVGDPAAGGFPVSRPCHCKG